MLILLLLSCLVLLTASLHMDGCFDPREDHLPSYWISLLENPCSHLAGPACPGNSSMSVESVGIVGAGISGLTMAWIFQYIGHEVTLLESSDRVGGRAFTHYGDGWYGDLGAMRFPPEKEQPLTHHLIHQFNCELATFTNTNEGDNSYFFLDGNYIPHKGYEANNQTILNQVYELFGIDTMGPNGVFPKNSDGTLINPASELVLNASYYSQEEACHLEESLKHVRRMELKQLDKPLQLIPLWSVMELEGPFLPLSYYEFIQEAPQSKQEASSSDSGFSEIVNGTQMLPNSIFKNITSQPPCFLLQEKVCKKNVRIHLEKAVSHIDWVNGKQVTVAFEESLDLLNFDKLVLTPTARAVSRMHFNPRLPYSQKTALDSFNYMNSVKIFLAFNKPFWALENQAPIIPFSTSGVNGGSGINDMLTRSSYYPSHSFHGNSILASYVWGEDADLLTSLTEEELIWQALADLKEIHGPVVYSTFKEGKVKKWLLDDNTGGAFPWASVGDIQNLLPALRQQHDDRLFFAGEYTSKMNHGWIQGAVESSCRVANDMFGIEKHCDTEHCDSLTFSD